MIHGTLLEVYVADCMLRANSIEYATGTVHVFD